MGTRHPRRIGAKGASLAVEKWRIEFDLQAQPNRRPTTWSVQPGSLFDERELTDEHPHGHERHDDERIHPIN
jgi:hypothetical protein